MKRIFSLAKNALLLAGTLFVMLNAVSTTAIAGEGYRGFSIGAILNETDFETIGRENEQANTTLNGISPVDKNYATVKRPGHMYPSWFMEYTWGENLAMTVGIEHINGKTSIGAGARGDAQGDAASSENDTGTRAAKATIENVNTIYIEPGYMVNDWIGVYGKAGVVLMDINTEENNLPTSSYGNLKAHPGGKLGLGVRIHSPWGLFVKLESTKTFIKKVDLKASNGLTRIRAKPEMESTRLAVGINF